MALAERIRAVLAIDPEADALEFEGEWHTWGELAAVADAVAAALDAAGQPAGASMGLLLRNRPAMVAALLGVLVSRRCAVTVNPHQGEAKLAEDLRALELPVLLGGADDLARPGVNGPLGESAALGLVVSMDASAPCTEIEGVTARSGSPPSRRSFRAPQPDVAVEMLTSGTTGPPKRVSLRYDALARSLIGAQHYERDRVNRGNHGDGRSRSPSLAGQEQEPLRLRSGVAIVNAPLVHVGGLWRVLQCVADGRRFALLDRFSVDAWLDLVRRHQPRTASLVPAALRMVFDADLDPAELSSLRAVVSGTAPLPPEDAEAFEAKYGVPVLTTYGATEFAGGVAGWTLADHRAHYAAKRGSVGRAHPGCELRVVDAEGGAVQGPGDEGLLEVRSAQLGPDSGWVRTTDRAVLDADGFLFIRGRADAAILRGGFKVHPESVRAVLEAHPLVREACVVGMADRRLGEVPVAAVELVAGASGEEPDLDERALREFARERLVAYEVPARVRIVDALPRTPSMKASLAEVRGLFAEEAAGRGADESSR